jgi:hypothetical protein
VTKASFAFPLTGGFFRGVRGREGVLLVPVDRALPVPTLPRHRENTRLKLLWDKKGLTLKGKPQERAQEFRRKFYGDER